VRLDISSSSLVTENHQRTDVYFPAFVFDTTLSIKFVSDLQQVCGFLCVIQFRARCMVSPCGFPLTFILNNNLKFCIIQVLFKMVISVHSQIIIIYYAKPIGKPWNLIKWKNQKLVSNIIYIAKSNKFIVFLFFFYATSNLFVLHYYWNQFSEHDIKKYVKWQNHSILVFGINHAQEQSFFFAFNFIWIVKYTTVYTQPTRINEAKFFSAWNTSHPLP